MVENIEAVAKMVTKAAMRGKARAARLVVHSILTPPRDGTISLAVELPTGGLHEWPRFVINLFGLRL